MTNVILLSAKAQNGKDTFASMLRDELGDRDKKTIIVHYADLLKHICKSFFNWDGNKDIRGRSLLQYVGTDVIREKQPDFWVSFVVNVISMFPTEWDYVIVADTRFDNEIEVMKNSFPTKTIRIFRTGFDNGLTEDQKNHASETSLDDYRFDYYVENKSLSSLRDAAKFICEDIMNPAQNHDGFTAGQLTIDDVFEELPYFTDDGGI